MRINGYRRKRNRKGGGEKMARDDGHVLVV